MPSDRVRVGLSTGFARDAYLTHCDFSELESVAEVGYLSLAEFEEGTLTAEDMANWDIIALHGEAFEPESVPENGRLAAIIRFGVRPCCLTPTPAHPTTHPSPPPGAPRPLTMACWL